METVILVIHLMIAAALVATVLLQRSEGGALGIGGGGGNFMTGRGAANFLTRLTAILAAAFFATSIILTLLAEQSAKQGTLTDRIKTEQPASAPKPPTPGDKPATGGGILDKLQPKAPTPPAPAPTGPQVPQSQ